MSDFLEKVFLDEQEISEKAKKYVLNEERMKKKITQVNGEIMLCQVRRGFLIICVSLFYKVTNLD